MYTDWGSFFDDDHFDETNFYSAAGWVWGNYLNEVVEPDELYSEEEMVQFLCDLTKIVSRVDFIERTEIDCLFTLEETLDTADYILVMAANGLNAGAFTIQDMIDNQEAVARYILLDNINAYYDYEFHGGDLTGHLTGKELLIF